MCASIIPAGCLEQLFGSAADGTTPAPPKDTAKAATTGWHGLRVKWSGKGRAPAGFRMPQQRHSGSSSSSHCSSPRATRSSGDYASSCMSRSSLDMMGPADAAVMLAAAPVGAKLAAAAVAGQAETAGGQETELADTAQAAAAAAAGPTDRDAKSMGSGCGSFGGVTGVVLPAVAIAAAGRASSGWAESPGESARRASVTSGCGSGCWALEDGCGCGCSTLPRLRRLEAEQVGGGAWLCSA
jgi:hypothetical protein